VSVVVSLLRAIDRADGEALVMHVGEKPYVVTAAGHAELASKVLTIPAMTGMLDQLLPPDSRHALDEVGAVEYQLPPQQESPDTRYNVVAARGGDDIWIEVRRRKEEAPKAAPPAPAPAPAPPPPLVQLPPIPQAAAAPKVEPPPQGELTTQIELTPPVQATPYVEPDPDLLLVPPMDDVVAQHEPALDQPIRLAEPEEYTLETSGPIAVAEPEPVTIPELEPEAEPEPVAEVVLPLEPEPEPEPEPIHVAEPEPVAMARIEPPIEIREPKPAFFETAVHVGDPPQPVERDRPALDEDEEPDQEPPHLAAVVPMTRPVRHEQPSKPQARAEGLSHLLQAAAAQGASVLHVSAQAKPSLRVDGEIRVLDHEAPLTEAQVEAGLVAILPRGTKAVTGEMQTCDVSGVGRVQVLSYRDHRGLGAMFRMLPARAISSEQMGLSAPIQALCTETEGLVVVAGARGSGKSTLTAALVDQINRTRRDHVITVEQQIQFVHDNRLSFVSQREARDDEAFAAAVRSALREGPDVLVIDQVMSPETATFALHAASNGHLVIAAVTAPSTAAALSRFIEFFGDERAQARATLGEHLRGVITQTLLRKTGGGRAAAREVLVNVPTVSAMMSDGAFDQLASVLNGGRRVGMVPLNDALLGLVQSGALDVREAYRKSPDQQELVTLLNRAGLDTTFAERLA
jgi:twitching motility protein PilT